MVEKVLWRLEVKSSKKEAWALSVVDDDDRVLMLLLCMNADAVLLDAVNAKDMMAAVVILLLPMINFIAILVWGYYVID